MESERLVSQPSLDHFLESDERATADKENVGRINREEFLMRMFTTALWRNVRDRAFEDLQQRLLHSLAGYIARDRWVLILTTNLVDLVNIDDALLRAFDVAVRGLEQLQNNVFNVFTNVTRFSQRCRIDDGEGNCEHARQSLSEQRLARAGRSDQQDVSFLNLNV